MHEKPTRQSPETQEKPASRSTPSTQEQATKRAASEYEEARHATRQGARDTTGATRQQGASGADQATSRGCPDAYSVNVPVPSTGGLVREGGVTSRSRELPHPHSPLDASSASQETDGPARVSTVPAGAGDRFPCTGVENSHQRREGRVVCPTPIYMLHTIEKRLLVLPCKQRKCPVCGPQRWKPYQQARYMSGLDKVNPDLLKVFTLTAPGADKLPGPREVYEWNEQAGECWERFVRLLRAEFPGSEIEVWKVWEHQRKTRAALHCHGIIRGLRWIPMETLRGIAVAAGFGPRIQLERCKVEKGGVRGLLGYFSKYLLKAVEEWASVKHVITSSRGWAIDWKQRNQEKRASEWIWISERDAIPFLKTYVAYETWGDGRADVLGPPENSA
jgi:hypothetical protein